MFYSRQDRNPTKSLSLFSSEKKEQTHLCFVSKINSPICSCYDFPYYVFVNILSTVIYFLIKAVNELKVLDAAKKNALRSLMHTSPKRMEHQHCVCMCVYTYNNYGVVSLC